MAGSKLKIVVSGYIGLLPAGGVTWDYIQYPLGFRELGHEVLYLEDTQQWPVFQHTAREISCAPNVAYLAAAMRRFDLEEQWAYCDAASGRYFGRDVAAVRRFCADADVLINLSCALPLRDEYAAIPLRALIDTDPMFTQVQFVTGKNLYGKYSSIPEMVAGHTHLFTFGENAGRPGCAIPCGGRQWRPTRQPVVLKHWPEVALPASGSYTSVFNWAAAAVFEFEGRRWGQKDVEFIRILDVPRHTWQVSFCIGVGQTTGDPFPADAVRAEGWDVVDPGVIASDADRYQNFIRGSRAEFSVAKHTYVQANTGWFSCRSVCYLASGRPVVTQDTGWSALIPNGRGLFAFTQAETAIAAIEQIERDPSGNARAARQIAEESFDSYKVLPKLLAELGA